MKVCSFKNSLGRTAVYNSQSYPELTTTLIHCKTTQLATKARHKQWTTMQTTHTVKNINYTVIHGSPFTAVFLVTTWGPRMEVQHLEVAVAWYHSFSWIQWLDLESRQALPWQGRPDLLTCYCHNDHRQSYGMEQTTTIIPLLKI